MNRPQTGNVEAMFKHFTSLLISDYVEARKLLYFENNKEVKLNILKARQTVEEIENIFETDIWDMCTEFYPPSNKVTLESLNRLALQVISEELDAKHRKNLIKEFLKETEK